MARNKFFKKEIEINGSFDDIVVPAFDWIKVDLIHKKTIWENEKTKEVKPGYENFHINISVSDKFNYEDKTLSLKIQDICKLRFPPYYWKEKKYYFYTTDYVGSIDDKKEILKNLFEYLKTYENEKNNQFTNSVSSYEIDAKEHVVLESNKLIMKFNDSIQSFVVLAKDYIGKDKYSILRSSSEHSGSLKEELSSDDKYNITTQFFKDNYPDLDLTGKTYFIIDKINYEVVKKFIKSDIIEENEFIKKQKEISSKIDLSQYNIEEENLFGLKIKFVQEKQMFEIEGKGYKDPTLYNEKMTRVPPRPLLHLWALNFLYLTKRKDYENYESKREILIEDKEKIKFEEIKGMSSFSKTINVLASDWEKIKEIKENYEEQQKIWGRKEKSVKITHCDISSLNAFEQFPAVLFDQKGQCFIAYSTRRSGVFKELGRSSINNSINGPGFFDGYDSIRIDENGKEIKPKNYKFSITIKAIPISFQEAKYFMEEHPFAENIKDMTITLNNKLWAQDNSGAPQNEEERNKTFETILLNAELFNTTKLKDNTVQKKRLKI